MGVLGFEPRTSALSELRSSQLSYTPEASRQTKKPNRFRFGPTHQPGMDRASGHNHCRCCRVHGLFQGHLIPSDDCSSGTSNYRASRRGVNRKSKIGRPRSFMNEKRDQFDHGQGMAGQGASGNTFGSFREANLILSGDLREICGVLRAEVRRGGG